MKTIIVGLGNPILGDDGVGWKVAEEVKKRLASSGPFFSARGKAQHSKSRRGQQICIDVEFLSLGGISLMEHLIGYERAILIDAVTSGPEIGFVTVSNLSDMPDYSAFHITRTHDTSLQHALKLGKAMGAKLPEKTIVVGIRTDHVFDFGEDLSPPVAAAVPNAAQVVISLL